MWAENSNNIVIINVLTVSVTIDIRMEDPVPTYTYLVDQFKRKFPNLAYIHVIEPGAPGNVGPKEESVSTSAACAMDQSIILTWC